MMRGRPGIVPVSELETVPEQRRSTRVQSARAARIRDTSSGMRHSRPALWPNEAKRDRSALWPNEADRGPVGSLAERSQQKTAFAEKSARVSRAQRSMERSGMMRCRPGIVPVSELGRSRNSSAPRARRALALHSIRDTSSGMRHSRPALRPNEAKRDRSALWPNEAKRVPVGSLAERSHEQPSSGLPRGADYAASFTYSKSPGLLSMPTRGGEIQPANWPGSRTGFISEAM